MSHLLRASRRSLTGILFAVLALLVPSLASAQTMPSMTITPTGHLVLGGSVTVTVEVCQPWYPGYYANPNTFSATMQGQNVTSQFTHYPDMTQTAECDGFDRWEGSVSVADAPLLQTFQAQVTTAIGGYLVQQQVNYAVPANDHAVLVAPTAGFVNVSPGSRQQSFTVTNIGAVGATYALSASCSGPGVSGCSVSPSSVVLASHQATTVTAYFTASSTIGQEGLVTVTANNQTMSGVSGSGWADVKVIGNPSAGVVIARALDRVTRSQCVTAGLGSEVAMECGDLRIVHPLPAVTTLGKTRVPTLLYNSQTARPMPVALVDVTLPGGAPGGYTVQAQVFVNTVLRGSHSVGTWGGGATRRLAIPIDATGWSTGLQSYYVHVRYGPNAGDTLRSATEDVATVNRAESPFGAGWWLSGLEEVISIGGGKLLWIGGDGSTRVYTSTGSSWTTSKYDQPDTIRADGTGYLRVAYPGRTEIRFNAAGLHTSTTNRLGQVTTFAYWSGTRRLQNVVVPVRSGSSLTYSFYYDANNVLYQVNAPTTPSTRNVSLGRNNHQITSITDPDGKYVSFGYASGANQYRIDSRTNRRGYATSFSYNSVNHLTQHSVNIGGSSLNTTLQAVESYGVGLGAQLLEDAHTSINGPRTDVADITKIWVNRYGAPIRIRNAEGRETKLIYDKNWHGLVAETRAPTLLRTNAFYDSVTARLDSTKVGGNKTSYQWNMDFRFVTKITPPAGPVTDIQYLSNGNRQWEQTGGSTRRVNYAYDGYNQLSTVTPPGIPATTYAYNSLGNVSSITTPKGYVSYVYQNAVGEDTLSATPNDTAYANSTSYLATYYTRVKTWRDVMGRPTASTTYGPAQPNGPNPVPADSLRVEYLYDGESNVLRTVRSFSRPSVGSWFLKDSTVYDGAGRITYQKSPNGHKTFTLDPAGNVTQVTNGRGTTVYMEYDNLNRLTKRRVPQVTYTPYYCNYFGISYYPGGCSFNVPTMDGPNFCINPDTARFYYDAAGRLTRADNRYARVRRGYSPEGWLLKDTLSIRGYYEPGTSPCGPTAPDALYSDNGFGAHVYVLTHSYDAAGRRTSTAGPYSMVGCGRSGGTGQCSTTYVYAGGAGELSRVIDGRKDTTEFIYDNASRLDYIDFNSGIVDDLTYDSESRVVARTVNWWISDAMRYDAAGRTVYADQSGMNALNVNTYYGPLGGVVGAVGATQTYYGGAATEKFAVDAIGNRHWTQGIGIREPWHPDVNPERLQTINANGSLQSVVHPNPPFNYVYEKYFGYDGSGNLDIVGEREVQPSAATYWGASRNFYDAGDKLRGFNRAVGPYGTDNSLPGRRSVFEEYFYDALGRRVMVHSRRHSGCPSSATECANYLERTVWDGDQVVWEIRAPAPTAGSTPAMESDNGVYSSNDGNKYGQTAYVHAGGIDQPITVYRSGYNGTSTPIGVHPHQNWRGVFELGSKTDGTVLTYSSAPKIDWPGARATVDGAIARPEDGPIWFGNLIPGKTDGSGMQYMRNRYYDPSTGRFTQQDPIGLAGGMNLYGFAGGDPVNFSDPFGLSGCKDLEGDEKESCEKQAEERRAQAAVCRADAAQFGVSLAMNATGLSVRNFATTAAGVVRTSRALNTGGAAAQAAFGQAGGAFATQAALTPGATGLAVGLGQMGGTPNEFEGTLASIYTVAKTLPVVGAGLHLGEAIRSCGAALTK